MGELGTLSESLAAGEPVDGRLGIVRAIAMNRLRLVVLTALMLGCTFALGLWVQTQPQGWVMNSDQARVVTKMVRNNAPLLIGGALALGILAVGLIFLGRKRPEAGQPSAENGAPRPEPAETPVSWDWLRPLVGPVVVVILVGVGLSILRDLLTIEIPETTASAFQPTPVDIQTFQYKPIQVPQVYIPPSSQFQVPPVRIPPSPQIPSIPRLPGRF